MRVSNVDKHTNDDELPVHLCNYVDVYNNDHITQALPFMRATASQDEIEKFRLERDDVLITKDSESWNDIGVPALVTESANDLVLGYHLALLRPHKQMTGPYLSRTLQSKSVAYQFHIEAKGVTRYGLTHNGIQSVYLPLPPLAEQAAIVRYLDHADRRIRRYVSAKQKLIALLEEERQAVINRAVTRGLDPNVRLKPSGVEWLGDVPAHWDRRRLKSIAQIRYGLGQPPRESLCGVPLIRATNVTHGRVIDKDMVYVDPVDVPVGRNAFLSEREIIVVRSGAYTADSAIIPKVYDGAVTGYDMVVTVRMARPEFIALAMLSSYVRDDQLIIASTRSAQPHLNAEELGTAHILLPPLPEQAAIVEYFDQATVNIDAAIARARRQIDLLQEYRTRLIADVVTGKLDVRGAAAQLPEEADETEQCQETNDEKSELSCVEA